MLDEEDGPEFDEEPVPLDATAFADRVNQYFMVVRADLMDREPALTQELELKSSKIHSSLEQDLGLSGGRRLWPWQVLRPSTFDEITLNLRSKLTTQMQNTLVHPLVSGGTTTWSAREVRIGVEEWVRNSYALQFSDDETSGLYTGLRGFNDRDSYSQGLARLKKVAIDPQATEAVRDIAADAAEELEKHPPKKFLGRTASDAARVAAGKRFFARVKPLSDARFDRMHKIGLDRKILTDLDGQLNLLELREAFRPQLGDLWAGIVPHLVRDLSGQGPFIAVTPAERSALLGSELEQQLQLWGTDQFDGEKFGEIFVNTVEARVIARTAEIHAASQERNASRAD